MNRINFVKMHSGGNDFIIIDTRNISHQHNWSNVAKKLCHRKFSIGADGLILLKKDRHYTFYMRYYNSDGSIAAVCGNGARCVAYFAAKILKNEKVQFNTAAGTVSAYVTGKEVKLLLPTPKDIKQDFILYIGKKHLKVSFVNVGVPHAVIFVNKAKKVDIKKIGPIIRFHRTFSPEGTNVNFVEIKNTKTLYVRTYERGVEEETYACGTGVTASSIIAGLKGLVVQPVKCITSGGEILTVDYKIRDNTVEEVYLCGKVEIAFYGEIPWA